MADQCCPMVTEPLSCECCDSCDCMCTDCICSAWGEEYDDPEPLRLLAELTAGTKEDNDG